MDNLLKAEKGLNVFITGLLKEDDGKTQRHTEGGHDNSTRPTTIQSAQSQIEMESVQKRDRDRNRQTETEAESPTAGREKKKPWCAVCVWRILWISFTVCFCVCRYHSLFVPCFFSACFPALFSLVCLVLWQQHFACSPCFLSVCRCFSACQCFSAGAHTLRLCLRRCLDRCLMSCLSCRSESGCGPHSRWGCAEYAG